MGVPVRRRNPDPFAWKGCARNHGDGEETGRTGDDIGEVAAEMIHDYDRISVSEDRFIIGYRNGQIEVYDYYRE